MPIFEVVSTNGGARVGKLLGKIDTPAPLMYTRRGFPPPFTLKDLENLGPAFNGLLQASPKLCRETRFLFGPFGSNVAHKPKIISSFHKSKIED